MASYAELGSMDPSELLVQDCEVDYPSPSSSSDHDHDLDPAGSEAGDGDGDGPVKKKKRKAWGQPVPEIKQILPPRKRAKTAEEKEQRKNERILRNRRAADKSRQRQKAAQAELEQQNKDLAAENAQLKALLQEHGLLADFKFSPEIHMSPPPYESAEESPFPPDMNNDNAPTLHGLDALDDSTVTPVLSANMITPPSSYHSHSSPVLTSPLDLGHSAMQTSSVDTSGMTQYPAVVLCDLQCQPEVLDQKLRALQPNQRVNTMLTFLHCLTILKTFSTSMLSPMSLIFQTLAELLSPTSAQLESIILSNFHLIHILISLPATSTRPAVFRLKLLSRLLASNPSLAPLLETAADRALQQKVSEENWTTDPGHRWTVASLITMKWSIRWLEREHRKIRIEVRNGQFDRTKMLSKECGVDLDAVEKHVKEFDQVDPKIVFNVPTKSSAASAPIGVY